MTTIIFHLNYCPAVKKTLEITSKKFESWDKIVIEKKEEDLVKKTLEMGRSCSCCVNIKVGDSRMFIYLQHKNKNNKKNSENAENLDIKCYCKIRKYNYEQLEELRKYFTPVDEEIEEEPEKMGAGQGN